MGSVCLRQTLPLNQPFLINTKGSVGFVSSAAYSGTKNECLM
jgi:hypothetical protein